MNWIRSRLSWRIKIFLKLVLSQLPVPYRFWKSIGIFEHGNMEFPQASSDNFIELARQAGVIDVDVSPPLFSKREDGYCVLEIGPGDSLYSGVVSSALGASRTWLVDAGDFANVDKQQLDSVLKYLQEKGYNLPAVELPNDGSTGLDRFGIEYKTEGVESLKFIPSGSIDYCFSNAVLEHILKGEFLEFLSELSRVLKPSGVSIHRVDLKDHLGGGLNNLRFSDRTWESSLFQNSGFYTNRIRYSQMISMFESSGFSCDIKRVSRWLKLPLPRNVMDEQFSSLSDDDFLVDGFDVILTHQLAEL